MINQFISEVFRFSKEVNIGIETVVDEWNKLPREIIGINTPWDVSNIGLLAYARQLLFTLSHQ